MSESDSDTSEKRTPHAPEESEGGSGTAGPHSAEKDQAGSYARDAEQDPETERHGRADSDGAER
jgi:hypothetical protein